MVTVRRHSQQSVKWRRALDESFAEAPMASIGNDRWRGEFPLAENGRYLFAIEAWTRAFISWREYFTKKTATELDAASDLAEGIALLDKIRMRAGAEDRKLIADHIALLRALNNPRQAVASSFRSRTHGRCRSERGTRGRR